MFFEDVDSEDFRADLSPEQLDALERRQQHQPRPAAPAARPVLRLCGADRGRERGGANVVA